MARAPGIPKEQRLAELGEALRWRRRDLRLQQAQVAQRVAERGVSCTAKYVQQLEGAATHAGSGERKYPSRPMFAALLDALAMREDELRELCERRPWASQHLVAAADTLRTQARGAATWSSPISAPAATPSLRRAASLAPPAPSPETGSVEAPQAELVRRFRAMSRLDQQALLGEARRRTPQLP